MTLHEITGAYQMLLELLRDAEATPEAIKGTIEGIDGELEVKLENYGKIITEIDSEALALKAEEDRLSARRKVLENSSERMKKAVEEAMRAVGKTKVKTELYSFGIQKNPASLKLADEIDFDNIPMEYVIFPEPKIDKEAVKDAIKGGATFDWAHMEQSESLRIR